MKLTRLPFSVPMLAPKAQQSTLTWRDGKTTAERGYGSRWQRERDAYLMDNPLCTMCGHKGLIRQATVVDHIIPHRGDEILFWSRSNWQSLCASHHSSEKQRIENRQDHP